MDETNISASQRVLLALREAKNKIETLERYRSEPIAVIGMGCRFPGAPTPDTFWSLLSEGNHGIGRIPPDRFPGQDLYHKKQGIPGKIYIQQGGFLNSLDQFDPYFFGISPREAEGLDPQQRLAMEVTWEALQHAGQNHASLKGSQTGVFMGMGQNDYARLKLNSGDLSRIDAYDGSGNLSCFASGRLGYLLGGHGPNMVVDTACSSSLVALHLACQSLRQRECDMALAGGVHLIASPEITVFLCQTGVLAPDGMCKTFDADADGFARGEGCGMLALKRLSDARDMKDNILALIPGSAVNHDGRSGGLTVPNENAQSDLIRRACMNAGVSTDDISYLEAHGTGTSLGDPIEVAGLASVFGGKRPHDLLVGSVKTNIGHLEAAAGVAGVIKTILALQHGMIPPHLNFKTPNPLIDWDALPIKIPQESLAWPDDSSRRLAGVSSFGMSGTNAHVILEASQQKDSLERTGAINPIYKRERYWVEPLDNTEFSVEEGVSRYHPLLGRKLRLPMSCDKRFEVKLTCDRPGYIRDHLVFGKKVVPGASHLVSVLMAALDLYGSKAVSLEDILFLAPLVLEDEGSRFAQVILTSTGDETASFSMVSSQDGETWIEHVSGNIRTMKSLRKVSETPKREDVERGKRISSDTFYGHLSQAGFDLGSSFQWGEEFLIDNQTASCSLRPLNTMSEGDTYPIHPGFLDTCFQLLSSFWETGPETREQEPHLFVPFSIDRLTLHGIPDRSMTHRCRAWSPDHEKNGGDLQVLDQKDLDVLSVTGFRFRKAEKSAFGPQSWKDWRDALYHISWNPSPHVSVRKSVKQKILFFCNEESQDMLHSLELKGYTCIQVFQADSFRKLDDHRFLINPHLSGEFDRLFTALTKSHGPVHQSMDQMVCLWGMSRNDHDSYSWTPENVSNKVCSPVLHLLQSLLKNDWSTIPPLTLVTRIGWALENHEKHPIPVSAPLWGLCRSMMREHGDFPMHLVDLDPGFDTHHAECLDHFIRRDDSVRQIAYKGTQRLDASLVKLTENKPEIKNNGMKSDASYLISGGFGGLGLTLARLMAKQGAMNIILCGRSEPSARVHKTLKKLREEGVHVVTKILDISNEHQVKELFQDLETHLLPLKGVFHAAGIVQDAVFLNQSSESMASVMAPKIRGAWHLHQFTQTHDLDYFVLFSSMAALFGSAGQANYAAANCFLDGLATYRKSLGKAGLSVNWGPFKDVGMASRLFSNGPASWQSMGVESLSSDIGMEILLELVQGGAPQVGVFPGNSSGLSRMFLGDSIMGPDSQDPGSSPELSESQDSGELLSKLENMSDIDSLLLLTEHIKKRVGHILKITSLDRITLRKPLFDTGLDSLMAVALKNQLEQDLGLKLRTTLIFDYPTVEALVDYIHHNVLNKNVQIVGEEPALKHESHETAKVLDTVGGMSDEDVLAALKGEH